MKIALYNFEPKFCPDCGIPAVHRNARHGEFDYRLRDAFICDCGTTYQKATLRSLLDASEESEGNLQEKVSREHKLRL